VLLSFLSLLQLLLPSHRRSFPLFCPTGVACTAYEAPTPQHQLLLLLLVLLLMSLQATPAATAGTAIKMVTPGGELGFCAP
jgi:hypothetical protein